MKKFILLLLLVSQFAKAQTARLGTPTVAGSGCPSGSVSVSLTDDASTISVLFSAFSAEYAKASNTPRNNLALNCRIQIPVELPAGYKMDVMDVEYRGFYVVPQNSLFTLQTTGLRIGKIPTLQPQQSVVRGPVNGNFQLVHTLKKFISSDCGNQRFVLDFTITMSAQSQGSRLGRPPFAGDTLIALDSLDSNGAGADLGVALKRCK